ncbi:MAG: MBL fold metallo-hydrolase [Anaerolineaceae bacterium]|jgi:hydroxyacylglutathione hydrolase|nr:MBL fold metallo-hydrolase [Anaerolineaceae bacterium]
MSIKIHNVPIKMASVYLIESENGLVLVDTGPPGSERKILQKMHALGRNDLRLIFITHSHFDHYGSTAALRRISGAPIAVHTADAQAMSAGKTPILLAHGRGRLTLALLPLFERLVRTEPTTPDVLLKDGDDLSAYGLNASVLHTPGHTPGSSTLLVEGKLAFAGDLISTNGRPHFQRLYATDWSQLSASLLRLGAAKTEKIYPGHGSTPLSGLELRKMLENKSA